MEQVNKKELNKMLLEFKLSMPNVGSWNGRWTGEDRYYAIIKNFSKSKEIEAKQILDTGYFHYNFGDGWSAGINVRKVDSKEANKIRKKSNGFMGYQWMIDSIIKNNKIICE
jgi:hypothetical protein